MSYPMLG
jgi:hypothetical protein